MPKQIKEPLKSYVDINNVYEIGVDECARGPLFGRLYVAATILPKCDSFSHSEMKDSKKIHSMKKMRELSDYIKENSIAWHIHYIESDIIDKINIRQAVLQGMRECIRQVLLKVASNGKNTLLVIDGNDFTPYTVFDETTETICEIPHITVEKGDNTYSFIAASSILAKNAHDEYILELCERFPELKHRYNLHENVGYGTAKHLAGIKEHGITQWHRKTFGCCKNAVYNPLYNPVENSQPEDKIDSNV
jgi:ribonuclease HII